MLASTLPLLLARASVAPPAGWSASLGASAGDATTLSYVEVACAVFGLEGRP